MLVVDHIKVGDEAEDALLLCYFHLLCGNLHLATDAVTVVTATASVMLMPVSSIYWLGAMVIAGRPSLQIPWR